MPELNVNAQATFTVNSTADISDAVPGNGVCRTAVGTCTLGAVIEEANARAGADIVIVPAGMYRLGSTFYVSDALTVSGAGATRTFSDGGYGGFFAFYIYSSSYGCGRSGTGS